MQGSVTHITKTAMKLKTWSLFPRRLKLCLYACHFIYFLGKTCKVSIIIIPSLLIENLEHKVTQLITVKTEFEYKLHILTAGLEHFLLHLVSIEGQGRGKNRVHSVSINIIYITYLNSSHYITNVMSQMVFINLWKSCVWTVMWRKSDC